MAGDLGLPENFERAALLKNVPDEVKGLPYFYPKLSDSLEATKLVAHNSEGTGYFLLRLSSKGDDYLAFTISIDGKSVRHVNVKIEREPSLQYFILEQIKFNSMDELQQYYKDNCITNAEKVKNVKLLHPIKRGYDDREIYEKLHPPNNRSKPIQIPGKNPEPQIPKTPKSQQLTAELPKSRKDAEDEDEDEDAYLPQAQIREFRRRSSTSRALPPRPPSAHFTRPPCPPPQRVGEPDVYYSRPTDENRNRIEELRDILKRNEDLCDCGIRMSDAALPLGWTLHMSHDAESEGCVFFQNTRGDTTWTLPREILPELTAEQYRFIVRLSQRSCRPIVRNLTFSYLDRDQRRSLGRQELSEGSLKAKNGPKSYRRVSGKNKIFPMVINV